MARSSWTSCVVLGLFAAGCADGEGAGKRSPIGVYSVAHYDYALDLATNRATATLSIEVEDAGDCLAIPFGRADFESVSFDGSRARHVTLEDGVLSACGRGWDAGETAQLEVTVVLYEDTWGFSQVGYSIRDDLEGEPFTYLLSWVGECDRVTPCDPRPDVFATYRFTVEHEPGVTVLCPGTITAESATRTVCDFQHDGGPTYSTFGVMAGRSWTPTPLGDWGPGVEAVLYDSPSTGIAAAIDTAALEGFFEWMVATFGAYPYGGELRFVTAPTYWLGFEHPGNIALSHSLATGDFDYAVPLTHVTAHEIAHQWAGDQTTLAGVYDFVWKEAVAEYLTFVYEDEALGAEIARQTARTWKNDALGAGYHLVPGEQPPLLDYYDDVYGPGPMVLFRQIESAHGREAVLEALRSLLGTPRAIGVDDVQAALEAATGEDLGAYFDAWVHGTGAPAWPRATVGVSSQGPDVEIAVTLSTADGVDRTCPFPVRLLGTAGNMVDVPLAFDLDGGALAPVTVTPGFEVTGHVVDPDARCLVWEAAPGAATAADDGASPWIAPM